MNFVCSNDKYLKNILGDIYRQYKCGETINISYEVIKQTKTLKQLRFIFGGLIKALCRYLNNIGYNYPIYAIKHWLYTECGAIFTDYLPNGESFVYKKTLSEMSKIEASEFIENVINFIDSSEIFEGFILPPEIRYCWTHNIDDEKINQIKTFKFNNFDSDYLRHQSKMTCIKCGAKGGMVYHLNRYIKKDWATIPLCSNCYDSAIVRGETVLIKDIHSVLNGLKIDDFCLMSYYQFLKYK